MKSEDVPSIVRLPLEVLEVFVDFSSISAQLSISRVSRLFYSLTLRALYRDISLGTPSSVVACCRTLTSNPNAASTVRSFLVNYAYYSPASNSFLAAYYSLIKRALSSLLELQTLKLLVYDPYFVTLLNHFTLPALRQFECYLTPSAPLIEFLNRHPRISYLQVSPNENTSHAFSLSIEGISSTLPSLQLPGLQYFAGNVQSVPFLGTTGKLRAAIISWNAMDTDPDLAFAALQRSSCDSLGLLSCRRKGWNLDLIRSVSIRLPDLFSLHVSNVLLVDADPTETYLQEIRACLPRFTQLQRLNINCIDFWEMSNISPRIDKDFATVTEWGGACPSLVEISLPHSHGLSWYRISDNVWIPDPRHTAGGSWLYDTVVLRRHPKWNTIVASLEEKAVPTETEIGTASGGSFIDTIAIVKRQLDGILKKENIGLRSRSSLHHGSGEVRKAIQ
ncbi:hypothetical protein GALMADRAFT_1243212 [Galerina marginata CBS 339.88]|uniref:F-box domain-containing protein n=1 Tax=Galerina marginata (strain CBS 339.88) TaxID=685588 RepID=A0A067TAZ1_GALM3|nr:hypothetical protein GALMADRAFT_1243212 [Galerina marginata CBS 339.88]